ncbi:MAG: hypothetical protein IPH38_00255 [Candidatus Microthrix sp.]|nr:hypothetical protein [Candidatus Microthrix sp.]MBK7018061.1 hypothetical protein [Candidatus Microthrix sp.]
MALQQWVTGRNNRGRAGRWERVGRGGGIPEFFDATIPLLRFPGPS